MTNGRYWDVSITNEKGVEDGGVIMLYSDATGRDANGNPAEETIDCRFRAEEKGSYQFAFTFAHDESLQTSTRSYSMNFS